MTENKNKTGLVLLETFLQGVLIFFTPRALRLLGASGQAPINSPRTLQHICKPPRANTQSKGFQKSCNFAIPPLLNLITL
jgi:hypothetical protein